MTRSICLAALVFIACKEDPAPVRKEEPVASQPPPVVAAPPDAAPPPTPALPSDPKQLAEMRNKAILDGQYDQALKICAAEDVPSIGEQAIMACVLAACQRSDVEKAQKWGQLLKGPLKVQAKKICLANKVPI